MSDVARKLLDSTFEMIQELVAVGDGALPHPSDHVCAQGKDVWTLVTNCIDHDTIHAGQILEGRYEARATQSPVARLTSEWLELRARVAGVLLDMSEEELDTPTAPGEWTYRQIADHLLLLDADVRRNIAREKSPAS